MDGGYKRGKGARFIFILIFIAPRIRIRIRILFVHFLDFVLRILTYKDASPLGSTRTVGSETIQKSGKLFLRVGGVAPSLNCL